jgi:membrane-bound lytic murein transglycosylase D
VQQDPAAALKPAEGRVAPEPALAEQPADDEDAETLETQALEACQAGASLLAAGDRAAGIEQADRAYALMLRLPSTGEGTNLQAKQDLRLLVADLVTRAYRTQATSVGGVTSSSDLGLPMVDNEHVQREIKSFLSMERDQFFEGYRRSGRYRAMIVAKLQAAGLPSQLSWLPLVESAFKVNALSRASALGLWQFISSTGLRYGLERNDWIDERLDPDKATDAAIAYLSDLHRLFGDWPKALAAYNCGENAITRLQTRKESQYMDFWDLYGALPNETRRYVPRLIAVLQLVEHPEKFGVALPELEPPAPASAVVPVQRAVQLEALDAALSLPGGTLSALNPELRNGATPKGAYNLRLPAERANDATAAVAKLPEYSPPKPKYVTHRVRTGETLSVIAKYYRTSVSAIMRMNNLRSSNRISTGQQLRIPSRG